MTIISSIQRFRYNRCCRAVESLAPQASASRLNAPVTDRRNGAGEDRRKGATWKGSETRFRTPSRMLVFGPFFNA